VQQSGDPVQPEGAERSREELERSPLSAELVATGLKKHFGGITAVDGVDVTIRAGELLGLIGPNGAGKSTLFSLLTGFIAPDEGQIAFRGKSILGQSANKIANMGLVRSFQDVRLIPELTVLDNVALAWRTNSGEQLVSLFCAPRKAKRSEAMARTEAMRWLEFVGMQQQRGRRAGDLAHAEQKLVALARVLMTGGEILLLDEPTSGVEHRWIEQLAAVIAELPSLGRGVCVVEHNLTFLRMLNAPCLFMEGGRVAASGTLDELMSVDDMRRAYFGI
jgi:ABC-type branched-subunit amino acid transport system ATPase component